MIKLILKIKYKRIKGKILTRNKQNKIFYIKIIEMKNIFI